MRETNRIKFSIYQIKLITIIKALIKEKKK